MFSGPTPTASPAWHVRRKPRRRAVDERRRKGAKVHAELGRVGADADDAFRAAALAKIAKPFDQLQARRRTVRPVDVGDQEAADADLGLGRGDALAQAVDDRSEILAGGQVAGRREEHLAIAQAVGCAVDQRLVRDASPVSPIDERLLNEPEDRQERIERVVAVEVRRIVDRQRPAGLACELDHGLGPDRALDMAVQLDLRDPVECVAWFSRVRGRHGDGRSVRPENGRSMAHYTLSTHVAAPPDHVFALWTNLDRIGEWIGGVTGVSDVSGPIDTVGTTYVVHFGPVKSPTEILEVERPRRFATKFGSWVLRGRSSATFEPDGDGTRITQEFETVGRISAISAWIFSRGSYEGSFRGELEKFARIAERETHRRA